MRLVLSARLQKRNLKRVNYRNCVSVFYYALLKVCTRSCCLAHLFGGPFLLLR